VDALRGVMHVVRVSSLHETEPADAPPGSPWFLNAVLLGYTTLAPLALLDALLSIERRLGRRRTGVRNEPRVIDIDLIAYGATLMRTPRLTLPHPRAHKREFVLAPWREVSPASLWSGGLQPVR